MAGTKAELKERDTKKIKEVPEDCKAFWKKQLKYVKKQLYGHS